MKKLTKRIACGALALMMSSTLAVEGVLRLQKDGAAAQKATTTVTGADFKNVTGQFDTSALRESMFNDTVLKNEDVAPAYETRTVIVTLSKKPLIERAKDEDVNTYVQSFSGELAKAEVRDQQDEFLRALSKAGISYSVKNRYDTVLNGVAIEVHTSYVKRIKEMAGVKSAVITTSYAEPEAALTSSGVVTNETDVYQTGIYDSSEYTSKYGEGTVVAVLDTGLDYTHPAYQQFLNPNTQVKWSEDYVASMVENIDLAAESAIRSGSLNGSDVYVSAKVPYAYDYADDDTDVYPSFSNHGTHVAGIIGGYDPSGYTDKDGNAITDKQFLGVAPNCQLVICKVFTDDLTSKDLGGAVTEDIVAALEDCVKLGVDVINMSLGTSCGFTTTDDGDDEGEMLNAVYNSITDAGISLICAASNDYSAGYGGVYGTNLAENPDSGTVGSPATYASALAVASINGQKTGYVIANAGTQSEAHVFYEESRDADGNPFEFAKQLTPYCDANGELEYVVVPGVGHASDYATIRSLFKDSNGYSKNRLALVSRGDTTFEEKVKTAMSAGAIGILIYNNVAGTIRMNLGNIDNPIPAISISMNAGAAMKNILGTMGKIKISQDYAAGPFMSDFSSWGPTHDLKLKPEITAHGGEITSTVPGGYGEQSGTSMATPNMAGFMAVVRSYLEKDLSATVDGLMDYYKDLTGKEVKRNVVMNRLAMQLTMSTAGTVYDQEGYAYSPRKQGAGVAKMENVIGGTKAYLWTDVARNDYRPKIEVFDNEEGVYVLNFNVTNFGSEELVFSTQHLAMTETLSRDKMTVSEQAYMLKDSTADWTGVNDGKIVVPAGETKSISVTLTLGNSDKGYINNSFPNGMYVEGFLKLISETDNQCDLSIPFLGFYGDWDAAPMLDMTAFEVAAEEQDASILDEDKRKASVFATLPYTTYYNEKYVLPMGGYVYLLDENDEPMYVDENHCSVSRYNEYYGEGATENYLTSTAIKAVYAGLLRNARVVKYKLYNVDTGELMLENEVKRVGKAYSGGGSAVPANVKLELSPEEEGLLANGMYRMEFEFFTETPTADQVAPEENTYEFSFTVDYEAPIMEDARVRYYTYEENNQKKQRIYLDVDVFDNHYAQAILLCYPKLNSEGEVVLQLATDYPTPVRNANRNGTTTVSIEITDLYEKYGEQLYVQIDDYAINTCLYQVNINTANGDVLPGSGSFELGAGESELTLDIYQAHKTTLVYDGAEYANADPSNFLWTSQNPGIADVKNGEIVGISAGTTVITVSDRKSETKTIKVTVTDKQYPSLVSMPEISFGLVKTNHDAVVKAQGMVDVSSGESFRLDVLKNPWYHPMNNLKIEWFSYNEKSATVDQDGNVQTLEEGLAIIEARVWRFRNDRWEQTSSVATVYLNVQNPFTSSSFMLTEYNGVGYNAWLCDVCDEYWVEDELKVVENTENCCPNCAEKEIKSVCVYDKTTLKIPESLNVMYISEEAFKDNNNIKRLIISSSVVDIQARAFYNCTALEEVYFVSVNHRQNALGAVINPHVDFADLSMIYEQAFLGCTSLKKIDFSNVKTATVAMECFYGCTALEEVVDMPSIGTMHNHAFAGCTSLTSVDLTGLHMSGTNVFDGCSNLAEIKTGKFTAIGDYMFAGCTALTNEVQLYTGKIGVGAFANCANLKGVRFLNPKGQTEKNNVDIGARAFENCGKNAGSFTFAIGKDSANGKVDTVNIRSIGDRAFAGSALKAVPQISGLKQLGADVFVGTGITQFALTKDIDLEKMLVNGAAFSGVEVVLDLGASSVYSEANGVIYNKDQTKLLYVNQSVSGAFTLPDSVTEIGAYAFADSKVTSLKLNANLAKIGKYAFENSAIRSVDFNNNTALTAISEGAFCGSAITAITLPETVKEVGAYAFADSAIGSFTGKGVVSFGTGAFENAIALNSLTFADSAMVSFGDYVFNGCSSLKSVALPNVAKMGAYNFYGTSRLENVTFGDDSKTIGTYTFYNSNVKTVALGNALTYIGDGAFYGCYNLTSVNVPATLISVGSRAFYNARQLASFNFANVTKVGDNAFYNTALRGADGTLNLPKVESIGENAFAYPERDGIRYGYTKVEMPVVRSIGNFAFSCSGLTTVTLPASLQTMGYGVFAAAKALTEIKVADGNQVFLAKQGETELGALYRKVSDGIYELTAYPAGRAIEEKDGVRMFTAIDGTARIESYAFYGLKDDTVNAVVLPYSVNAIGDAAFLSSGITTYTFESIQAPALETVYRAEVADDIEAQSSVSYYKGYYYANFETLLYNYSSYIREDSPLKMYYPTNGVGYDNHVYKLYFGERTQVGVLMEDQTRECIALITNAPDAAAIDAWTAYDATVAQNVITARIYYNNVMLDAAQAAYVTEETTAKLLAVESALRAAKARFGIPVSISSLRLSADSTHKTQYVVGETFDMTGVVVIVVYDDYSTEVASFDELTLLTTKPLSKLTQYVEVSCRGKVLR